MHPPQPGASTAFSVVLTLTLTSQTPQALLFTPTLLLFPISASLVPGVPTDRCLPWPAQCLLPADVLLCTGSRGKPFICPFPSTRWAPSEYQSAPGGRRGGRREVGPGRELVPGTKQMGFLHEDDQEPPGCLVKEAPRSGQSFQKDVLGMGVRDRPEAWVGCSARHPGRLLPAASPLGSVSSLCSSRSCPLPGCVEYVSMVVLPTFHVSELPSYLDWNPSEGRAMLSLPSYPLHGDTVTCAQLNLQNVCCNCQ